MKKLLLALSLACASFAAPAEPPRELRLYALDCGRLAFEDLGQFSDTFEYEGHSRTMQASCFVIRHPDGVLLWDAGLGDGLAATRDGRRLRVLGSELTMTVPVTMASQLASIGLDFSDIDYFAFSHGHADHLGNADALVRATWIVNRTELAWLRQQPAPQRTDPALIRNLPKQRMIAIDRDHDVFGDGSVRILSAPGHTPGHQVLLVRLPRTGPVLLSGDLYHTRENRGQRRIPAFNVDRADTLASIDRIERIVANLGARVVIQHAPEHLQMLPRLPGHLD
ncbi:N-acyl homoserine lactonase family protein [Marilutibacter chinensis]|uniref:N-acyl homoserine lactonase family protein n=1 Tax=Marilutibacter chinensis TaxID=2912247 RepID=A0ABS9HXN8_9GAMM|nr:N-acyl homoserine lactonase family protein [Lysobacter chinensis]MCF7223543.1 N-acyl homoserine lactonase family protein [Lysobacter chinensis]